MWLIQKRQTGIYGYKLTTDFVENYFHTRQGGIAGWKIFFLGGITWFLKYGNGRESVVASRVLRGGTVILIKSTAN